ncbi:SMC-Scp complex subunit ScpB [Pseudooceanicola sp.]|uniref:SMC-Scp complex subunit ScpB n=1 Tax=Pseudooceanicola sp. TaxID=1914328 RepID=UPI000C09CC2F|nr:SMC-Scp complex subunit ScpB [Pseudooceanicola sp.]
MTEPTTEPGNDVDAATEPLFETPPLAEQERMVEAILFASAEPVTIADMSARMPHGCTPQAAVQSLMAHYEGRGLRIVRVGEAWAMRTAPDLGYLLQRETVETRKLSRAAIETLAIIAYHQPVTRAEIEEIRGVSVSRGTIDLLIEMEWIRFGRRRMSPGRPVTFVVTAGFLDHFGLETARDLPGLRELRAAGLLESRPPPGLSGLSEHDGEPHGESEAEDDDEGQGEMFDDDA